MSVILALTAFVLRAGLAAADSLAEVDHVVFFMQDNRAFDHYFGTLKGVRGFADPNVATGSTGKSVFHQLVNGTLSNATDYLLPWYLNYLGGDYYEATQCINAGTNGWGANHRALANGQNDLWAIANTAFSWGHYKRDDIPVHFAIADSWTIGDMYQESIISASLPNHFMWQTGTINVPGGKVKNTSGPVVDDNTSPGCVALVEGGPQAFGAPGTTPVGQFNGSEGPVSGANYSCYPYEYAVLKQATPTTVYERSLPGIFDIMSTLLPAVASELGLPLLLSAPPDAHLLILQRIFRILAYGQSTLVLASHLHALGVSDFRMGLFMTLTLIGDVGGSFVLTVFADRWGRRRVLILGCALMSLSGVVFSLSSNYVVLLLAAVVGVISPSGSEIGPFKAIEESTLATLIAQDEQSTVFAWNAALSGMAGALGSLSAGWITSALQERGWSEIQSYRFIFVLYTVWGIVKGAMTLCLTERCEASPRPSAAPDKAEESMSMLEDGEPDAEDRERQEEKQVLGMTTETLSKLKVLSILFGLDNLASGLVPLSFIIYFFTTKFSLDPSTLGTTFFTSSLVAALSNLVAASLARRIGNIKTMAFTHLPSAIFLTLIPLPAQFWLARLLLIARFCTSKMDGAPRSAFTAAYVSDQERTSVMGILNVVKTVGQSVGPTVTGYLTGRGWIRFSFIAAGCMKVIYDIMILHVFARATRAKG